MATTSIPVEKMIRDKVAQKAKKEPRIELIEVDKDTQALMDDVVTEWDKR